MRRYQYEHVPNAERLWKGMLVLILTSYGIDTVLLTLFAFAGVLSLKIALGYGGAGLAACGIFYLLITKGLSVGLEDPNLTLAQLSAAVAIQLTFMVLAPQVALYFVSVLFVIFGFASLRLRPPEGLLAWLAVSIPLALILAHEPAAFDLPRGTTFERALVGISILLALGRATMLGLYSTHLRVLIGLRLDRTEDSLRSIRGQRGALVASLHEGLSQDLAGISFLLGACVARLRREAHPCAAEIGDAVEHIGAAIGKTRLIADSVRAESGRSASDA